VKQSVCFLSADQEGAIAALRLGEGRERKAKGRPGTAESTGKLCKLGGGDGKKPSQFIAGQA